MQRYATDVRDGVLYLEVPAGGGGDGWSGSGGGSDEGSDDPDPGEDAASGDAAWLEIGPMDEVVELVGGEEYVLEYDERQRQMGWLDTDAEGRLTFDVRETVRRLDFDDEFVRAVAGAPADESTDEGYPKRAVTFADLLTTIWDAKGDL